MVIDNNNNNNNIHICIAPYGRNFRGARPGSVLVGVRRGKRVSLGEEKCSHSPVDLGFDLGEICTKLENGSYDAEFNGEQHIKSPPWGNFFRGQNSKWLPKKSLNCQ